MITKELQEIINFVNLASNEIPFENSAFQNITSVLKNELTPGRALRHGLLRLNNKIAALRECYYSLEKYKIDVEEMEEKISDPSTNKFEVRRLKIDIEQKQANMPYTQKLIKDCIVEIQTIYNAVKNINYTRKMFENEEKKHWELKHARSILSMIDSGSASELAICLDNADSAEWMLGVLKDRNKLQEELKEFGVKELIDNELDNIQKNIIE